MSLVTDQQDSLCLQESWHSSRSYLFAWKLQPTPTYRFYLSHSLYFVHTTLHAAFVFSEASGGCDRVRPSFLYIAFVPRSYSRDRCPCCRSLTRILTPQQLNWIPRDDTHRSIIGTIVAMWTKERHESYCNILYKLWANEKELAPEDRSSEELTFTQVAKHLVAAGHEVTAQGCRDHVRIWQRLNNLGFANWC